MTWIFEIIDVSGRKIHLSRERWTHINEEHPELAHHLEDIQETIRNPMKQVIYDPEVRYFYSYLKYKATFLLVIVKYLNDHGFIITAYFVRKIL